MDASKKHRAKPRYPLSEKWRKLKKYLDARKAFLSVNKHCVICAKYGRTKPATILDHIKPHRDDPVLFWGTDNWQAICQYHHDQKTATEDGALGNPERSHDWPDIGQVDLDYIKITNGKDLI